MYLPQIMEKHYAILQYLINNKSFNLPVSKAISTWLILVAPSNLNQVEMSYVILVININSFGLPEKKVKNIMCVNKYT